MKKMTLLETLIEARTTVVSELVKVTDAEIMKLMDGETPQIDTTLFTSKTLKDTNDKNDMDNKLEELECEKDSPKKRGKNVDDYLDDANDPRHHPYLNSALNKWRCFLNAARISFKETEGEGMDMVSGNHITGYWLEIDNRVTREEMGSSRSLNSICIFFDQSGYFEYFSIERDNY